MDINSYSDSDSDEYSKLPQPSAEETGAAHTDDERDAQQVRVRPVAAAPQNKYLNQQRVPGLGTPVDGAEQVSTQKAAARLAGPSIGGAGGPVPEFVRRLLAEELKEWTLAQGEMPSNGVKGEVQLDYMTRLASLAQLPCRTDDAVCNHWNRLQEPSTVVAPVSSPDDCDTCPSLSASGTASPSSISSGRSASEHASHEREVQRTPAPAATHQELQQELQRRILELQQRVPSLGAPLGGTERPSTQNVAASLAGPDGPGRSMPKSVHGLPTEELKEWTLAQGELLGNGVQGELQQADYAASLENLPCRAQSNATKRAASPPKLLPSKQPRISSGEEQRAAAQGMGEYSHHTHPHPSQRQPARPPPAPPLSQAPGQAPPQRPPQQRAALPPRPPPRPPHAPPQYQPQQYMSVPPGMGVPSGAQHWGSAGPGAYMVPANSMGMMPAPPMQAMYPGVNGYMMVPGAYMMAGMGSGMPPAWAQQWQQFQQ